MSSRKWLAGGKLPPAFQSSNAGGMLATLAGLSLLNAMAIWFLYNLVVDGVWFLAVAVFVISLGINIIFLRKDLYPLRWISPGLALIALLAVYPILFTVYSAFTNYSDGHLLTKEQAIRRITQETYLPAEARQFSWQLYRSESGEFALWLSDEPGTAFFAGVDTPMQPMQAAEAPQNLDSFKLLSRAETVKYLTQLQDLTFGSGDLSVRIKSINVAAQMEPRYLYLPAEDAILDQQSKALYLADPEVGIFETQAGDKIYPGYQVPTGFKNFERMLTSPALRGPLVQVFIWTVIFAFLSVLTTFLLGLLLAIVLDSPGIPAPKLIRSFLILPYAVPGVILILIWRGLLNPHLGIVNHLIEGWLGWAPAWFSNPNWTRIGILLVNLYLGYPYMMLICSGALKAIPRDIYEAAEVDGANGWQQFWNITLPFLLISVGPLLVSSFTFNFNNFNVIYLFNEGGPPIPNTPTPAGHTDILISYTYRLAFAGERGSDYGYAAAIAFVIFLVLCVITIINFRFTRIWEEVSENV